jgi:hypothetical protein
MTIDIKQRRAGGARHDDMLIPDFFKQSAAGGCLYCVHFVFDYSDLA